MCVYTHTFTHTTHIHTYYKDNVQDKLLFCDSVDIVGLSGNVDRVKRRCVESFGLKDNVYNNVHNNKVLL